MSEPRPGKKARKIKTPDQLQTATIGQVLAELHVFDWDVLIVGDGSGTSWERGCGWASVLIEHYSNRRKTFNGAMSVGTVNIGEVLPYVQAMSWYSRGPGKARLHDRRTNGVPDGREMLHVHVITDSEVVANQGNNPERRKSNTEWWAALDHIASKGYLIHWHWMARDRLGLNVLTDHLSRASRVAIEAVDLPPETSVYDFNPGATFEEE
jgi:ribonuclease HI